MNEGRRFRSQWGLLPIAGFLIAWEMVARLDLVPGQFFLPAFSEVMWELILLIGEGILTDHLLKSGLGC